jgi:hypothetical protein
VHCGEEIRFAVRFEVPLKRRSESTRLLGATSEKAAIFESLPVS